MTTEPESPSEDIEEDAPPETDLPGSERAFVRLTFWQTVLSLVGVFIAIVALYAALSESEATRKQTAAAVWPFVQLTISDHLSENRAEFSISLTNAGVGPARMRSMRVLLMGKPLRDWHHAMELIGESGTHRLGQHGTRRRSERSRFRRQRPGICSYDCLSLVGSRQAFHASSSAFPGARLIPAIPPDGLFGFPLLESGDLFAPSRRCCL